MNRRLRLRAPVVRVTAGEGGANIQVSIVESPLRCPEGEVDVWNQCRDQWRGSQPVNDVAWQRYRVLVESGCYHFIEREGNSKYGFAEAYVALALLRMGYSDVWTGAYLFRPIPKEKGIRRNNSVAINDLLRELRLPSHEQFRVFSESATDVDLAAYDAKLKKWCFCEAKRDEKVGPKQVTGLALLRLLTGADVGIVRLTSRETQAKEHFADFFLEHGSRQ